MNRPPVTLATPWRFPAPQIHRLGSGLTVWQFHLPGQHLATFELVLPAPLSAEPTDREGVATVALHAIDEGTLTHPDGRIGELLETHGASLQGSARRRYTTLGGQAPGRRLTEVLELFTEVLREPAYASGDVAHQVEAQVAAFDTKLASPGTATRLALRRELFGPDHRDGRPDAGTPATLAGVTAEDARRWHRRHFSPRAATLLVAGDLTDGGALAPLDQWAAADDEAPAAPSPAPRRKPRVVVVDRRDAVQATIVVGLRTVTRDDPRWPALRLAGQAVAGAFASRLNLELRERLGYTYGIGGGFSPDVDEALFTVSGSVRTEVAGDAVARLLAGLALDDAFLDEEVDDARRYLIGVAPLANETSADIVGQASALAAAGLDPGFMNDHFADLTRVTAEEATLAFREEVSPERLTVAVAGDADTLVPALTTIGLAPELLDLRA